MKATRQQSRRLHFALQKNSGNATVRVLVNTPLWQLFSSPNLSISKSNVTIPALTGIL
jgi:hypothetical protein